MNKENMVIGNRIRQKRLERGWTLKELGVKVGISASTILRYENGEINTLKLPVIESIANALGVDPAWLVLKSENPEPHKPCKLNVKRIPILGTVAAGKPILAEENIEDYFCLDSSINADFALKVKGDSMINARICDGDLVFVRKQPVVENGEIAAVLIDSEVTLKRFYKNQNGVILKPENCKYEPVYYTEQDFKDIRILGKAVYSQSKLERK